MRKKMKLQTKLTILIITVVFISISIIIFFVASWMNKNIESTAKTNVMNVAEMVANSKPVIDGLNKKDPNKEIGPYIDKQLKNLDEIEYIIVVDNDGTRYSHPNSNMIGQKFVGGDEGRVVKQGDTYISEATGTLGKSLRAFIPIYDTQTKKEIGFVCVGTLLQSIGETKHMAIVYIILTALGGLTVGIIGAFLLAKNIKNILLGLEPEEITRLYNEKTGIIDAVYEGLVAIDNKGKITIINDSALNILHYGNKVDKNEIIGTDIAEFFPTTRLLKVLETGKGEFEKEQRINNTVIMTNRIPIIDRGKIVGAIATFRDKTELTKLAEELTGVKKMAWSLRAQNHEFMNKLHTITGLIQLEEYDEAVQFISDVAKSRNKISSILTKNIKDSYLSAILFSKYNKAEENRVKFKIDEDSMITKLPQFMNSEEIVSIIGNLVENSLDAVSNDGDGEIYIKIEQQTKYLKIKVKDNGPGIKAEHIDKIYEQGFTTKEGERGHGMYIVKQIVDDANGTIEMKVEKGVIWDITIPMVRSE
ncbi:MAG: ATP-binding protein [Paraclostridium sp.]|uniref:ATP-binding protein n=1 Tax=Paraclostridium sp. TaxID=2023273 RepID=UPI003F358F6E